MNYWSAPRKLFSAVLEWLRMEFLTKLLGGAAKVKILRLFLLNQDTPFDVNQSADRAKVSRRSARREIDLLEKIAIIKRRSFFKEFKRKFNNGRVISNKRRVQGWITNERFKHLKLLQSLMTEVQPLEQNDLLQRIKRAGRIKLIVIAGVFIQDPDSRLDMLIVGDDLKQGKLDNIIRSIESELGKELRYAVFETQHFNYRMNMYDKLIRDVLDFPHKIVTDRLGLNYPRNRFAK